MSFFAHNRLQSIEADEAHWFTIKLYRTDFITRSILQEIVKHSKKNKNKLNQAVDINNIYPFVTSVHFAINPYYKHNGKYHILKSEKDCFFFDIEVTPYVFDGTNNFSSKVIGLFEEKIKQEGFNQITDVYLTDIGFDSKNLQLIVIGNVGIEYTKKLRKKKHIKISNMRKILMSIEDENDYNALFIYSCINLQTFIINTKKIIQ